MKPGFLDRLAPADADPRDFSPPLIRLQESPPSPLGRRVLLALFGLLVLGLGVAFPGHALDLVGFVGIAGPMTSALAQIAAAAGIP